MGLRKLLHLPKFHGRKRSKARSENVEGPSGAGPSVPPPAESAPDLRIGASTSPLIPKDQESNDRPSDSDEHRSVSNGAENTNPESSDPVIGPSAVNENKSKLKSLASSGAKLILRGVRESSDAFGPLKSVAGGLCFILDNCEQMKANKQSIESLAPRVKALSELLCAPVSRGDIREETRRKVLERKLKTIAGTLEPLAKQSGIEGFFKNVKNAEELGGLVDDIRDAVVEYQTSLQRDIYDMNCTLIERTDLALLDRMYHVTDAGYLCGDSRQGCMKGTRRGILSQLESWLNDEQDKHVFWLNGLAGTGKSAIAQTFAETSFADGKLGASFFCSRSSDLKSNLRSILPTLAFQLAHRYPDFRRELFPVLMASHDVGRESLCSQMEKLIVRPFQATRISTLIIVDALDECRDDEPASAILSVLSRYVDDIPGAKFFITGRPEPRIYSGFRLESLRPITEVLKLHEVDQYSVDSDITLFLRTRLTEIARARSDCTFPQDWPKSSEINILCTKAAGFFIYASTVVKFVASKTRLPTKRLDLIISSPQSTAGEGKAIDPLYTQVLEQAVDDVDADDGDTDEIYSNFKTVVGAVLLVFNPLSVKALSDLLKLSTIPTTLHSLHSLLLVPGPENMDDPIRVFHKSFPDFLTDPRRCKDERFFVDPKVHHGEILLSCLNLMKERLKKNICSLDDYVVLDEVMDLSIRKKDNIGDSLEYACCFWTKHLLEIPDTSSCVEEVQKAIDGFFTIHLLHWVEALVLIRNLSIGVYAMNDIEKWCTSAGIPCKWANDTQRFLLENFDTIHNSPSQIYYSALPFCPTSSWLCRYYGAEFLDKVKIVRGLSAGWGTCSRTVPVTHCPLDISYCDNTIAVSLTSGDIVILSAITGSKMGVFSEHSDWVRSVTFSSDGMFLVSGSDDTTIKLWDVQTGGSVRTFSGHFNWIYSVSISADSTIIASGSNDSEIRLWNIQTGGCHHIIKHGSCVLLISFFPICSQSFMAITDSGVQEWDISGNKIGPENAGSYAAFSLDGTQFALCNKSTVAIQDSRSRAMIAKFHVASHPDNRCCFSPDGRLIAASVYSTIYIWDISSSTPYLIEILIGHTQKITALAFSSPLSLTSISRDKSVKFWQIGTSTPEPTEVYSMSAIHHQDKIKSITLQATDGITITSDSDGVIKIWNILTGQCKESLQTPARGLEKGDVRLIDGRLVIAWYVDEKIKVWDIWKQSEFVPTISYQEVMQLRISGDGSKIFCLDKTSAVAFSTQTGQELGRVEFDHTYSIGSLAVEGSRVFFHLISMGGIEGVYEVLDSFTQLSKKPPTKLHPSGTILWDIGRSRVQDVPSGKVLFQLNAGLGRYEDAQWMDQYLVICFASGKVLVLDFTYALLQ